MGDRIDRNENAIAEIKGELRQMNKKITEQSNERPLQASPGPSGKTRTEISTWKEAAYNKSRRSIRAWPIEGTSAQQIRYAFRNFMRNALRITAGDINAIVIDEVRRVRSSPNSQTYMEVTITFKEIDDRDFVASHAINLGNLVQQDGQPKAGI